MQPRSLRFSQVARDQLARLKRHTGIEHLNVLARWALCTSLSEESRGISALPAASAERLVASGNIACCLENGGGFEAGASGPQSRQGRIKPYLLISNKF